MITHYLSVSRPRTVRATFTAYGSHQVLLFNLLYDIPFPYNRGSFSGLIPPAHVI